jgi:hypothetical protein
MKAKLLLTLLFSFSFYLLYSQVPQGFNYQAIATDAGHPVTTAIDVKITIQSLETGGTQFWIEQHSAIVPNAQGLFSIVVGNGVPQSGRTVTAFSDIDWSVTPKYIKTEILYGTWKNMGAAKLQSVPYSLVAKNLGGPVDKLGVTGKTTNMEEALFEVKNQAGKTVFAVYNEGVRIYVEDGAKGSKGGFAIGGFDVAKGTPGQEYFKVDPGTIKVFIKNDIPAAKGEKGGFSIGGYGGAKGGPIQKYMRISNDSTRFFVNDDPLQKGEKGGFSIGGFGSAKGVKSYFNLETATSGLITPSQNRILWYPLKNAFLAGRVRVGTPDSVGENSFSTGFISKAKGIYSQAFGYKSLALGEYSTAIGKNAVASSDNSFAFGDGAKTTNIDSYAFGAGAIASGQGSFAFGSVGRDTATFIPNTQPTEASGNYSFAIGLGAKSTGTSSTALGIQSSATGDAAMAIGVASKADGEKSLALNVGWASGKYSMAFGSMSKAQGDYSIAIGRGITKHGGVYNLAAGAYSLALGYSRVYGLYSIGIGTANIGTSGLDCNYGIGIGNSVTVTGEYAIGMGTLVTASSMRSFVVGTNNVIAGNSTTWVADDPLFVVGNGSGPTATSNAFTVLKNAKTGIGTANPAYNLESYGVNASVIAHYLSNARGGIAALSSGRVAVLSTASTNDIVFGYSSTIDQENFSSNFVEKMRLDNATGNFGIGTNNPDQKLTVNNGSTTGRYTTSGWTHSSDLRLKENINDIPDALDDVLKLHGVEFNFINDQTKTQQIGFIAQEIEKVFPEVVVTDENGFKSVAYGQIEVVLVEAIKEQQKQIKQLQEKDKEIDLLRAELEQIKNLLEKKGIK